MSECAEVVAIPRFERLFSARNLLVCLCIVIKGQLNVDYLKESFEKLVIEWPKLGANLKRQSKKSWELSICIPAKPTIASVSFTTASASTPLIPTLPAKSAISQDTIYTTHMQYFKSQDRPNVCEDILQRCTAPTTYIHVTSFPDATCIGVTVPHIMYDAIALCDIIKEWSSIIGGSNTVRTTIRGDPLVEVSSLPYPKTKEERLKFNEKKASTLTRFSRKEWYSFLGKFIADVVQHPKEKTRLVYIPLKHIDAIRFRAKQKGHWISENDVVTALLFKLSLHRHRKRPKAYMTLAFTANMRGEIPTLAKTSDEVFLGNANYPMTVPAKRIQQLVRDSVEDIAISIRATILKQREYEQIQMAATVTCESTRRDEYVQYQRIGGWFFYVTSWARGRILDFDFREAVKKIEAQSNGAASSVGEMKEEVESIEPGQVLHADGTSSPLNVPKRGFCVVFGKSGQGQDAGYWAEFTTPLFAWPAVTREIESWWE